MRLRFLMLAGAAAFAVSAGACSRSDNQTAQAPPPVGSNATGAASPAASAGNAAQQARVDQIDKALYQPHAASGAAVSDTGAGGGNTTAASGNSTGNTTGDASSSETGGTGAPAPAPMLIKAEVLLARANFSPGVIDGQAGDNLRHAVAAYAKSQGLPSDGDITPAVWARLNAPGAQPVAGTYTITAQDAAGPFSPDVGEDMVKMSKLDHVGYTSPLEMLAERFHMSQDLLRALNPGADFGHAGTVLVVAQVGQTSLAPVDHIQVDKADAAVRAYDKDGKLLAFLPATVGSTDRPSPSGTHKVKGVAHDPTYTYDPKKLTWGPKSHGKFTVPSGPNNPVGVVWIDLDAPSYGLHGTPDPKEIGKTASHGCVRMTNWDAQLLASAVKPGVVVRFVNERGGGGDED